MHFPKITFSLVIVLVLVACKKDKVPVVNQESQNANTCLINPTDTSFSQFNLAVENSGLYVFQYDSPQDAQGKSFDFDCDGVPDLSIDFSSSDVYNGALHTQQSHFSLLPLNSSTYLLGEIKADSTYYMSTSDTSGNIINDYTMATSTYTNGAVFQQVNNSTYLTSCDATQTLYENDPRWISTQLVGLSQYKFHQTFQFSDQNNYVHFIDDNQQYVRGIIPNYTLSWIPFKFITQDGDVKMGYLKIEPMLWFSSIQVKIHGWVIQR